MENQGVDLSKGSVGKLLFSLSLPSILAQVINVLYNMVDRMYIGHIEGVGVDALAGVGVTMPMIMAISAFAALVCMGAAPKAAIYLGKQDKTSAEHVMSNCFSLLIELSLVLTIIYFLFGEKMLMMFGANQETLSYALDYMNIYALGTIFVQISLGMNAFINTQGYAKMGMATVLIGAILNIILDPILIFGFSLGVKGAALATILSQAVSAIYVLWFLFSKRSYLHIQKKYLKIDLKIILPCLALGMAPFVMQITESVISVCFNASLLQYGGKIAVSAMAILTSVMQIGLLPLQGLTQGSQPIVSYNYGAGNLDRIRQTFKILLISSLIYSTFIWGVSVFMPQLFTSIFTSDPDLLKYANQALRVYMGSACMFGAQIACQQTFIALGNAKISLFLAVLRKIILLIPLIYTLPHFIANQAFAVFLAEPIADFIAVTVTCMTFYHYAKKVLQ